MHTLEHILEEYLESTSTETMEDVTEIISNFIEDMRKHHEKEVEILLCEIKDAVVPYLNEEDSREYLSCIVNSDGTKGPHWSKSQTDEVARKYGIDLTTYKFNDWDFYVAMNITYSDGYDSRFRPEDYVCIAKNMWLCDEDWAKNGKWLPGKMKWYLKAKHEYLS